MVRVTTGEIARCGQAAVHAADDGRSWTIGNGLIEKTIAWAPGCGPATVQVGRTDGPIWAGQRDVSDVAVTWNGTPVPGAALVLVGADAAADTRLVTLTLRFRAGDAFEASLRIRCWPSLAVLEQELEVVASRDGRLSEVNPYRVALTDEAPTVLQWISGVQQQGGWRPEAGPYRSFRREQQALGQATIDSGPRSTWQECPWFALAGDDGGLFAGLLYSGRWRAEAARGADGVVLDLAPVGIAVQLSAGERWTSPTVFVGAYPGDLDEAAAVQHDYHRTVLSPHLPADFPWVQYNTWFSYLCDFDADALTREVEIARDLGIELFYVDAGWWTGNPRHGGQFSSGLGTWTENHAKFADGLRAFADLVRAHGLRFGIWIEPERVDLRTATTGTWRTDWLVRHDGQYSRPTWPSDTETAWLCFGHPETQAWAEAWIGELIDELGVAWLKWDSNHWGVCTAPDHGHGTEDGEAAQLTGLYRVMDALRVRFPDLIIENCAGGGTRMDFAMARHTQVAWVNDASDPAHRVRFHLDGASYLFPPATLNTWVTESAMENLNRRDLPEPALIAIVRSRMLGALGFSCRMVEWPAATRDVVRAAIAEYKTFRHLLEDGYVSHLLPQPDLECPHLAAPAVWDAMQFRSADAGEAVILAFRNVAAADECVVRPKGLATEATYRVTGDDGADFTVTGGQLMAAGLLLSVPPLASALYRLRRVGEDAR